MAKSVHADVLDGALVLVRAAAESMAVLSAPPANHDELASVTLAAVAMAPADFALEPAPDGGRRLTVAAKAGLAVTTPGTASHVALVDEAGGRLLYVTTCPDAVLSEGGTVSIASWAIDIGQPA